MWLRMSEFGATNIFTILLQFCYVAWWKVNSGFMISNFSHFLCFYPDARHVSEKYPKAQNNPPKGENITTFNTIFIALFCLLSLFFSPLSLSPEFTKLLCKQRRRSHSRHTISSSLPSDLLVFLHPFAKPTLQISSLASDLQNPRV